MSRSRGRGRLRSSQNDDTAAPAAAAPNVWESFLQAEGFAADAAAEITSTATSGNAASSGVTRVYRQLLDERPDAKPKARPRKRSKKNSASAAEGGVLVQAGTLDVATVGRSKIKDLQADSYHLATPTRILPSEIVIRSVVTHCSAAHSVAIDVAGVAYGWGRNEAGQLGLHDADNSVPTNVIMPTELEDLSGPCQAAAVGKSHSIFLLQDGTLWAVGANKVGQCGVQTFTDVPRYRKCVVPDEFEVLQIACGEDFTLAVTKVGHLYSTGSSEFGQLGNGSTGEYFVTANKIAFSNCNLLTRRKTFCHAPDEKLHVNNQQAKVVELEEEEVRIGQVAAGKHHVIAVEAPSNLGSRVFSWGCGNYGDLGHGVQADEYYPRAIGMFTNNAAISADDPPVAAAGATCSLLRTPNNGHVFYWGKHRSVGEATMRPQLVSVLVNNAHNVRHVGAGGQTVVCCTGGAQTVAWGQGAHGELGLGKAKSSAQPTFVAKLDKCLVMDLACGYGHTLYVVQNQDKEDKKAVAQLAEINEDDVQELVDQHKNC